MGAACPVPNETIPATGKFHQWTGLTAPTFLPPVTKHGTENGGSLALSPKKTLPASGKFHQWTGLTAPTFLPDRKSVV